MADSVYNGKAETEAFKDYLKERAVLVLSEGADDSQKLNQILYGISKKKVWELFKEFIESPYKFLIQESAEKVVIPGTGKFAVTRVKNRSDKTDAEYSYRAKFYPSKRINHIVESASELLAEGMKVKEDQTMDLKSEQENLIKQTENFRRGEQNG